VEAEAERWLGFEEGEKWRVRKRAERESEERESGSEGFEEREKWRVRKQPERENEEREEVKRED